MSQALTLLENAIIGENSNDVCVDDILHDTIDPSTVNDDIQGEEITYVQEPSENTWKLPCLYKESIHDSTLYWQIGFDTTNSELVIVHGSIKINDTFNKSRIIKRRQVKLNNSGRTIQEQALLEARSRYKEKYESGYRIRGDELSQDIKHNEPMLANEYWPGGYNDKKKKNMKSNVSTFPVAIQGKLDGIRSLARKVDNTVIMKSRLGNTQNHLEHIKSQLNNFFIYLPEGCILDGELYSFDMDFNTLTSAIKTEKKLHSKNKDVQYYIFDIIESKQLSYEHRYELLINAYNRYVQDTHDIQLTFIMLPMQYAYTHEQIAQYHDEYVKLGYEGLIIRKIAGPNPNTKSINDSKYQHRRCNSLLKYKKFIDEEGLIIDVEQGEGTDKGLAIIKVRDIRGNEICIRPRGSFESRRNIFNNKQLIIGKSYTFRYFELTPDGVPRFPVGISIRDYE